MLQAYFDGVADEATTKAVETELNNPESNLNQGLAEIFGPKLGDPLDSEGNETATVDGGTLDQANMPRSRLYSERLARGLASVDEAMCVEVEAGNLTPSCGNPSPARRFQPHHNQQTPALKETNT